uniref:Uncharacterized protein n=2 Tax=Hemiselmis andersenii TaxID=464988 RepID=A0A7S1E2M7_HEMAN
MAPSLLGGDAKAAAAAKGEEMYTFVLFEGQDEKGEIKLSPKAKWVDFQSASKSKLGYDVGSIKYDDDFGPQKEQDIICKSADDWEDLLAMMEEDASHIKGELTVEVIKASSGAAAGATLAKAGGQDAGKTYTLKCFVGDESVKELSVAAGSTWGEVSAQLATVKGGIYSAFDYEDDGGKDVKVDSDASWAACLKVLAQDGELEVGLIAPSSAAAKPAAAAAPAAASAAASSAPSSVPSAGAKKEASKEVAIPEGVLVGMVAHKAEIISACAKADSAGTGALPKAELAKHMAAALGSALSEGDAAKLVGDLVKGDEAVDYALFCRRFRYVEPAEAAVLKRLSDPTLQTARVAVLANAPAFDAVLAGVEGTVNGRQLETLLKEKGSALMSAEEAAALASAWVEGEDLRLLSSTMVAVDIAQEEVRGARDKALASLLAHVDALEDACEAVDKASKGTLPLEDFVGAVKGVAGLELPRSLLVPGLLTHAGALKETGVVDYGTFASHCAVAHESELEVIRRGRSDGVQDLRKRVLQHKKEIVGLLTGSATLKEVLCGEHHPWKFTEEEEKKFAADVEGKVGGEGYEDSARDFVKGLQFSDFLGELEDHCDALFARWEGLMETCKEADTDNQGTLAFAAFESAMLAAAFDQSTVDALKRDLLREGHARVPFATLLGSRLRVLGRRELGIIELWRSGEDQKARLSALGVAGRVSTALAQEEGEDGLVPAAKVEEALTNLGVQGAPLVVKALPKGKGGGVVGAGSVGGLQICNVGKDVDRDCLKTLVSYRRGLLGHCQDLDKSNSGSVGPREWAHALHMRAFPYHMQEGLSASIAGGYSSAHGSKVHYSKALSSVVLLSASEAEQFSLVCADGTQAAREALVKSSKDGLSAPRSEPESLVRQLVEAGVGGGEEDVIKAVRAMSLSRAGEKGSLRSEDLTADLKAAYVCPEGSMGAVEKKKKKQDKGTQPKAGSGLTRGQIIWRDKVLKPRKPGVKEILEMMKGMPMSVSLSPLRTEVNSGNNLASASACRAEDPCRIVMPEGMASRDVVMTQVQVLSAEGVPGPSEDSYEVIERRCRVCMVAPASKRFVGGGHVVPLSRKAAGKVEWVFSKKEAINPFSLRAVTGVGTELYLELSALCRKKGTKGTGQAALNKGEIKELSCGHACIPLDDTFKAGKNKLSVPLFGGTPWTKTMISKSDVKQGKGLFSRLFKKPESRVHVQISLVANPPNSSLPPNLVCSAVCLEALEQFGLIRREAVVAGGNKPFTRLTVGDFVLATFPLIMDDAALMARFANVWSAASKKLGKKATKQQLNASFRECVMQFYPLTRMDPHKLPKDTDTADTKVDDERKKVIDTFFKKKKTNEALEGGSDFRYTPFRIDEMMTPALLGGK